MAFKEYDFELTETAESDIDATYSLSRTDSIAKYNRLMRIEIELGDEARYGYAKLR